ncbi:MAG: GspH/FimT family pseudopilin [Pseudomonadota bacterium]
MANPTTTRHHGQHGFTLVEAMITLAIAAILFAWAVPSLQDFIIRNRMSTEVNTFVTSLYVARSESVKRLRNVGICPAPAGATTCAGDTNWNQGWIVIADTDGAAGFNTGDTILQQNSALPSNFQITNTLVSITYQPNGRVAPLNNTTFTFDNCDEMANSRAVFVATTGRVRTVQLGSSNGC